MSNRRVANLWQRQMECDPHIAQSVVHTELGRMGREGVEMALSPCAQRDPKTARFYQGKAMHDALFLKANGLLLSGFSNDIIDEHFPPIEINLEMAYERKRPPEDEYDLPSSTGRRLPNGWVHFYLSQLQNGIFGPP